MKSEIKVAVLMGGPSDEHEVSLNTGRNVLENLDSNKYEAEEAIISKGGKWSVHPEKLKRGFDVAFVALHGFFGEDGKVQDILEKHSVAYTGSDPYASALGMNKFLSLRILDRYGFDTPHTLHLSKPEWVRSKKEALKKITSRMSPPWVAKPNRGGSSVDIHFVKDSASLESALKELFNSHRDVIVQEEIEGRELTCGVLDQGMDDSSYPLIPTEIIPNMDDFFDYDSKYEEGGAEEITPARISDAHLQEVRRVTKGVHDLLGCSGMSRTDLIMTPEGSFVVLEINTIPGLTDTSLLPQGAKAMGISFSGLLDRVIQSALRRHKSYH